jgi:hypothetical protein
VAGPGAGPSCSRSPGYSVDGVERITVGTAELVNEVTEVETKYPAAIMSLMQDGAVLWKVSTE